MVSSTSRKIYLLLSFLDSIITIEERPLPAIMLIPVLESSQPRETRDLLWQLYVVVMRKRTLQANIEQNTLHENR